tara:strand:+ start:399 stop:671 length:273 start_codon:yes stop_codon:yes gene_type:complete
MSLLGKIKSFFTPKKKPKKIKKELCDLLIARLEVMKLNSEGDQKNEINDLLYAIKVKQENINLRSKARTEQRRIRMERGFSHMEKYFNDL